MRTSTVDDEACTPLTGWSASLASPAATSRPSMIGPPMTSPGMGATGVPAGGAEHDRPRPPAPDTTPASLAPPAVDVTSGVVCGRAGRGRPIAWAAGCSLVAAAVHLALLVTPAGRAGVAGILAATVVAVEGGLGWRLLVRPSARSARLVVAAGAVLVVLWLVVRAAAGSGVPHRVPHAHDVVQVMALAALMASAVLASRVVPPPRPASTRGAWAWAALGGSGFLVVFLLGSGAVSFVADAGPVPSLHVAVVAGSSSVLDVLGSPLVYGQPLPHVWLVGSIYTLIFALGTAGFLTIDIGLRLRPSRPPSCERARLARSLLPASVGVASCCGPSLGILVGTVAMAQLFRATPWLLLVALFAVALDLRRLRLFEPPHNPRADRARPLSPTASAPSGDHTPRETPSDRSRRPATRPNFNRPPRPGSRCGA